MAAGGSCVGKQMSSSNDEKHCETSNKAETEDAGGEGCSSRQKARRPAET